MFSLSSFFRYLILIIIYIFCGYACSKKQIIDSIIENVYIVHSTSGKVDSNKCIAIANGKIINIAPLAEIEKKYSYKASINGQGNFLYPGFIDAHCHFVLYGLGLLECDIKNASSWQNTLEILNEYVKNNNIQPGQWIIGRGWDQNKWKENKFPNNNQLNILFPNNPVFLNRVDGHAAIVNQIALKLANITNATKVSGGQVIIENNKLSGVLIDNAVTLVEKIIPPPSKATLTQALVEAQKNCFAVGLTSVVDAGLSVANIELIDSLQKIGLLQMNIYAMLNPSQEAFEWANKKGIYKTKQLHVRSFKLYADGALGSRGAKLSAPYEDNHNTSGLWITDTLTLKKYYDTILHLQYQANTHAIGDEANAKVLRLYNNIYKTNKQKDLRWKIEHAQIIAPKDIPLFNIGIIPSIQPTHATSDMPWAKNRLGEHRLKGAYAYKSLLNQNGYIALGTDFPVENINPIFTFYAATIRKNFTDSSHTIFMPNEALTPLEALNGMTIWAAMSNFEEQEKGVIKIGSNADFTILDKNLLQCQETDILNTNVIKTIVDGKIVYIKQ